MMSSSPQQIPGSVSRLPRAGGAACAFCLAIALLAGPRSLPAQDGTRSTAPRLQSQATGPALSPKEDQRLWISEDRPGLLDGIDSPASPAGGVLELRGTEGDRSVLVFREASALERGWRLMGRSREPHPEDDSVWETGDSDGESGDEEPSFLVELFDAQEVVAWVHEVRDWGLEARRTLFGPRGFVRAGPLPGSDRHRLRVELTDSRPGIQVVVITR